MLMQVCERTQYTTGCFSSSHIGGYYKDLISKNDLRQRTESINQEIRACEREIAKLSKASGDLEDLERNRQNLMTLFEVGFTYDLGLIPPEPYFVDEQGQEHGTNQENWGWIESGAERRRQMYKELGIRVLTSTEGIEVEISGKPLYLEDNR